MMQTQFGQWWAETSCGPDLGMEYYGMQKERIDVDSPHTAYTYTGIEHVMKILEVQKHGSCEDKWILSAPQVDV